jgi:hypothetical protein
MFEVQTQNFGVSVEAVFQKPVSLREAQPETCAEKLVAFLHSWNLKATRLELYKRDSLYSFELNGAVYGESVKILLNSERFYLSFANGRTQADFQTIAGALIGFSESFMLPPDSITAANLYAHSSFSSSALYKEYLSRFGVANVNAELSGAIAYLMTKTWTESIRFQIDRSEMLQSGLFLSWTTKLKSWPLSLNVINAVKESTDETSEVFGLKFAPLVTV